MNKNPVIRNSTAQFLIYKSDNQDVKVDALLQDENIWLTIEQMGELFGKGRSTINEHILNIYKDEELEKELSMRKSEKPIFLQNQQIFIILI